MHGNEVYGIELYNAFVKKFPKLKPYINLVIGNKKAFSKNSRFIDTDMNRAYGIANPGHENSEIKRAEKEMEAFKPDYIIDVHTTRRSSGIFFITDTMEGVKNDLCSALNIDVLVMGHEYTKNSFVGTHELAVSIEYSLVCISQKTTDDFVRSAQSLIEGISTPVQLNRAIYNLSRPITENEFAKYPKLKSYDKKVEGVAMMVPKNHSEMDAEYYGFWCKSNER